MHGTCNIDMASEMQTTKRRDSLESSANSDLRLYSVRQISGATVLGAPIAGCWLMAENYRAIGRSELARRAVVFGAFGTLGALVLAYFVPEETPSLLMPMIYVLAMDFIATVKQGAFLKRHFAGDGARQSNWRVVGIGISWLVLLLLILLVVVFSIPESVWLYLEGAA